MSKDNSSSFRRLAAATLTFAIGLGYVNNALASPDTEKREFSANSKPLFVPNLDTNADVSHQSKSNLAKGVEMGIDELLDKVEASQKTLSIKYSFIAGGINESLVINGGATLFEHENDLVYITAGHLFGYRNIGRIFDTYLKEKYKMQGIWTQNELVENIKIDGIELSRDKFGYYFESEEIGGGKDIGYIVINKDNLTVEQYEQLKKGALKYEDISFDQDGINDQAFGICYSGANKEKPIVALDAKTLDKYKNFEIVGPFDADIKPGCSGNGMFGRNKDGDLTFNGVVIQLPPLEEYRRSAVINKLSSIGREGVFNGIMKAAFDIKLQKTNPHTKE